MKDETLEMLINIMNHVNGDWKDSVRIDNDTDNELSDAYNQGVEAMAAKVMFYLHTITSPYTATRKSGGEQ